MRRQVGDVGFESRAWPRRGPSSRPLVAPQRSPASSAIPGDGLLHPIVASAVLVLVFNDHVLKAALPGLVTGKLSDFAGLLFFPLVLVAAWEVAIGSIGRWHGPRPGPLVLATIATGLAFVAVKATASGAQLFALLLGSLQWLAASAGHLVAGGQPPIRLPVSVAHDPTDLVALVSLVIALVIGLRRIERARQPAGGDRP